MSVSKQSHSKEPSTTIATTTNFSTLICDLINAKPVDLSLVYKTVEQLMIEEHSGRVHPEIDTTKFQLTLSDEEEIQATLKLREDEMENIRDESIVRCLRQYEICNFAEEVMSLFFHKHTTAESRIQKLETLLVKSLSHKLTREFQQDKTLLQNRLDKQFVQDPKFLDLVKPFVYSISYDDAKSLYSEMADFKVTNHFDEVLRRLMHSEEERLKISSEVQHYLLDRYVVEEQQSFKLTRSEREEIYDDFRDEQHYLLKNLCYTLCAELVIQKFDYRSYWRPPSDQEYQRSFTIYKNQILSERLKALQEEKIAALAEQNRRSISKRSDILTFFKSLDPQQARELLKDLIAVGTTAERVTYLYPQELANQMSAEILEATNNISRRWYLGAVRKQLLLTSVHCHLTPIEDRQLYRRCLVDRLLLECRNLIKDKSVDIKTFDMTKYGIDEKLLSEKKRRRLRDTLIKRRKNEYSNAIFAKVVTFLHSQGIETKVDSLDSLLLALKLFVREAKKRVNIDLSFLDYDLLKSDLTSETA